MQRQHRTRSIRARLTSLALCTAIVLGSVHTFALADYTKPRDGTDQAKQTITKWEFPTLRKLEKQEADGSTSWSFSVPDTKAKAILDLEEGKQWDAFFKLLPQTILAEVEPNTVDGGKDNPNPDPEITSLDLTESNDEVEDTGEVEGGPAEGDDAGEVEGGPAEGDDAGEGEDGPAEGDDAEKVEGGPAEGDDAEKVEGGPAEGDDAGEGEDGPAEGDDAEKVEGGPAEGDDAGEGEGGPAEGEGTGEGEGDPAEGEASPAATRNLAAQAATDPVSVEIQYDTINDSYEKWYKARTGQDTSSYSFRFSPVNTAQYGFADGVTPSLSVEIEGAGLDLEDHIVPSVSPDHVTVNLFDYWLDERDSLDAHVKNDGSDWDEVSAWTADKFIGYHDVAKGINTLPENANTVHPLVFHGGAAQFGQGYNNWTGNNGNPHKDSVYTGIVQNTLVEGYPKLALTEEEVNEAFKGYNTGKYQKTPTDHNESLDYLFNPKKEHPGKASYEDVKGLFQIDENGNYHYSSLENFAEFDEGSNSFRLYDTWAVSGKSSARGYFFPFNSGSEVFQSNSNGGIVGDKIDCVNQDINHYFGVTMEVDFQQPNGGIVSNGATQKPMQLEFIGDDDIWIFIDGVLVADMGGIHDSMRATINFQTGDIKLYKRNSNGQDAPLTKDTTLKAQFEKVNKDITSGFSGDTFATNTTHKLQVFYLERGNGASNLELSFNLLAAQPNQIVKVDQKGDALSGVTFDLYKADDSFQATGDALATLETDKDGFAELKTGDGDPIAFQPKRNYVLKEATTLPGYITTGDIHLTYSDQTDTLTVQNSWTTGAVAGFEAQVDQAGELKYNDGTTVSTEVADQGLILAVPMYNAVNGGAEVTEGWQPMYGSVSDGFSLVDVDTSITDQNEQMRRAVLEAALRQTQTENGEHWHLDYKEDRFQGLLVDLPGSPEQYVFVNKDSGNLLTAYYLFTPAASSELADAFAKCKDAEEKHDALTKYVQSLSGDQDGQLDAKIASLVNDQQKGMKLLDISGFNRRFYIRLYIPNQVRELRVYKQNEDGKALEGAEFTLFSDSACQTPVARGITDQDGMLTFSAQNTGDNVIKDTDGALSSNVNFAIDDGESGNSYWLRETKAPDGYERNETVSEVRVTEDSLYVNAGSADDGVSVRKGVGQLLQTMVRYAAAEDLNITLRDITASKYTYDAKTSGEALPKFSTTGNQAWTAATDEQPMNLHYGLDTALVDYGLHEQGRVPYFSTDTGWLGFAIKQNYDAHKTSAEGGDDDHWSGASGIKQDVQNQDLSHLLTGTTTVVVTDQKKPDPEPGAKDGTLKISKTVRGSGASTTKEFSFTLALKDKNGQPLTGNYSYTGSKSGTLSLDRQGEAHVTLAHEESITVAGLPDGAAYRVSESDNAGYTVTQSGDTGTIRAGETSEASFENYKGSGGGGGGKDHTTSVTVQKVWKLDDGGTTPSKVTVGLFRDGVKYKTVTLSSANRWKYTWSRLDDHYEWTVQEIDVPDGFTMSVEQSGNTFTITNDDVDPDDPKDPDDPDKPADPDDPKDPNQPTDPDNPGDPSDPDNPSDPSDPSDPDHPSDPGNPDTPGDPSDPGNPSTPDDPQPSEGSDEPAGDAPQTGDSSHLSLWVALLGVSGLGLMATLLVCRKKRYKAKHLK